MKREKRIALALEAFRIDYNCSHSVLLGYPDLMADSRETILKQAAGFGGGIGRLQMICGAITGAVMVLGLYRGAILPDAEAKETMARLIRCLADEFGRKNGTITCSGLIGVDLNTPEGKKAHKETGIRERICEKCIADAISIVEEILAE
jgi:C_GCAxxG_C_C family probable redox protein